VVYHYFGWTLARNSVQRFYLSHRNTIVMLVKNWPMAWLLWALPVRLSVEMATIAYSLVYKRNGKHALGIAAAIGWVLFHPFSLWSRRRTASVKSRKPSRLPEKIYHGSILWDYFIGGIRTGDDILKSR
jgi:hypothetical protein